MLSLSALFMGFYLLWLGSYPLFTPDEARYSEVAREMLATGNLITPKVNGIPFLDKPVLYYWLQAAAIALFGVKEWALRLVPTLCGLLGCLMTYACGRKLFDRKTGVIAATILATSPLYFGAAHYANLDLEVATWISCSLLCIITGIQSDGSTQRSFMLAAYLFAAFAALTKGLIGIVFPVMITGTWIALSWRWGVLKKAYLGIGTIILVMLTVPWYLSVQHANPDFLHYFFVTQQYSRFLSAGEFNNKTTFWFYFPVIILGFFPWSLFAPLAITRFIKIWWRNGSQHGTELFLLLWLTIIFVFFSVPHSKLVGYILPIFPALALITGRYLALAWETASNRYAYITSMALILFFIIAGIIFATAPHYNDSNLIQNSKPLLGILATATIVGATLLLLCLRYVNIRRLFIFCVILNVGMLLVVVKNAHLINTDSTRNLVAVLKAKANPQDVIVDYFKFHQDIPIYLGKTIQLVADWDAPDIDQRDNWVREMWLGRSAPGASDILIPESRFWKIWHSDRRVFVFVNDNYLEQFKRGTDKYQIVAKENNVYLISNR